MSALLVGAGIASCGFVLVLSSSPGTWIYCDITVILLGMWLTQYIYCDITVIPLGMWLTQYIYCDNTVIPMSYRISLT